MTSKRLISQSSLELFNHGDPPGRQGWDHQIHQRCQEWQQGGLQCYCCLDLLERHHLCCTADTIWCGFTAILVSIELHRWQASWGPEPPDAATSLRILGWINFKIPKFALLHIQKFVLQQHACNDNSLRDSNQTTTWVQLRRIRSCRNRYFLARAFGYFSDKSLLRHLRVVFRGFVCRFIYIYPIPQWNFMDRMMNHGIWVAPSFRQTQNLANCSMLHCLSIF